MKCKKCGTELIKRSGKFGDFYCCPKSHQGDNHGTVSASKTYTPAIDVREYNEANDIMVDLEYRSNSLIAGEFGYVMTPTDLFLDIDYGDGEHWTDFRPY